MSWFSGGGWRRRRRGSPQAAPRAPLDTVNDVAASVPARLAAMVALERSGGPHVVAALCTALDDAHPEVCRQAAEMLRRLGDPAAVEPLCRRLWHLVRDPEASFDDVGWLASALSGFTGDPRPIEPLRAALLDWRSYLPRTVAVDMDNNLAEACIAPALRELGGQRLVIDGYAKALRHDDEYLRRNVAKELAGIAWRVFTSASADSTERELAAERAEIGRLMGTSFDDELTADEREALRAALRTAAADPSPHVRNYAEGGLEDLSNSDPPR
jgi:HEAT repeat protein